MLDIKFSCIIPARNEADYLQKCLTALEKQELKPLEIIVIDNGSTDETKKVIQENNVRYIFEPKVGLTQARQAGFENSKGNWLVYIDADTIVPKNYLTKLSEYINKHPHTIALSNPFGYYDGTKGINLFTQVFFNCFSVMEKLGLFRFLFGGNFVVKKSIIEEINGFDTDIKFYGEDTNLTKRVCAVGEIHFLPKLKTLTSARRFKQIGFWATFWAYASNYLSFSFVNKPFIVWQKKIIMTTYQFLSTTLIVFLLLFFAYQLSSPQAHLFGKVENRIPASKSQKTVALTFDDGPNGQTTEQVLSILGKENVKATFFMIGENVKVYPDIAKKVSDQGNEIGNHSYYHSYFLPFENKKQIDQDLIKTNQIIYQATGQTPKLFRPPHGWRTPWLISDTIKTGLTPVAWNDMTFDYIQKTSSGSIEKNILKHVKPGSIIVLHDGLNGNHGISRTQMLKALPIIIETLKKEGYTFVTL
ncbi:MAG: polysaccharide deacetylase family protein [Candidatus Berkelbacteria bacterium]